MIIQLLFGYTASVLMLFGLVGTWAGLKTALLGFGLIFSISALGVLAVWWWEEHQRLAAAPLALRLHADTSLFFPKPLTAVTTAPHLALLPLPPEARNLNTPTSTPKSLDALAPRAAVLTDRLAAVYPLMQREDLYKIIWMTMVEIYHEQHLGKAQGDSFAHTPQPTDEKKTAAR